VKPENVMIKRDGHVTVLDFGIVRQAATPIDPSAPTATSDGQLGTITEDGARVGIATLKAPRSAGSDRTSRPGLGGRCSRSRASKGVPPKPGGGAPGEAGAEAARRVCTAAV
jgi:serine/threonine protein kinase